MLDRFRLWPWPEILILLIAAALRFAALDVKPPHFDEGVNGWFADRITETGFYDYDPTNYHGPLHMYAVFAAQKLLGRDISALRLPSVLASLICVWLMLRFGRFIGPTAARWAAAAMAVSPACVFYGRYSIHESELLAFLLITTWGVLELWHHGSRRGLFAVVAGLTGMILTKETYFIHAGCLALAIPTLWLWQKLVPSRPALPVAPRLWKARDLLGAVAVGAVLIVAFYSGFFLNWHGVTGLWETYAAWFKTGVEANGHAKTDCQLGPVNYYWLKLMALYEWPALLGVLACFRLLGPTPGAIRYLAIAGAGALVAYSIIPYKTPWLILVLLWPFFFTFGALMQEFARYVWVPMLGAAAVTGSMMKSIQLNFRNFDNPREPYVYVQTFAEIRRLTDPLLERARRDPNTYNLRGAFILGSYYPLPWMLGDFHNIGYHKDTAWPPDLNLDFIAAEVDKADRVEAALREPYYRVPFRLRDAQADCVAWFRVSVFRDQFPGPTVVGPAATPAP